MVSSASTPLLKAQPADDSATAQFASGVQDEATSDFDIDQILYCSLMREPMDDEAMERLAQMAANLNRMDHITGLLMQADGVFVQLIEGPREAVNHLWARILHDQRHHGVVQLYHRREVESRACSGWDMRYVKKDDLRALIHEAKEEVVAGRKSAWAPAIERMDFLLSNANWDSFVKDIKQSV
jgi:Sensors of blue-light using FAD